MSATANLQGTCREQVLTAAKEILRRKGLNEFTIPEVVEYLRRSGSSYEESTIRTHITSRCCKNAPPNHGTRYSDYERIGYGVYRLTNLDPSSI